TRAVKQAFPGMEVGVHLHSTADTHHAKLAAAWQAGCRRFDAALRGLGGCPMAGNALVGNMNTEWVFDYLNEQEIPLDYDRQALKAAAAMAQQIFQ
ncbi:MAG: hydroxymethylglutaryl-CoA lyase, partial [Chitinophagaceae bacterium]|nr:hydroxymethylglutaryl-CoA lyase [Chitinophagaceae bacterium]